MCKNARGEGQNTWRSKYYEKRKSESFSIIFQHECVLFLDFEKSLPYTHRGPVGAWKMGFAPCLSNFVCSELFFFYIRWNEVKFSRDQSILISTQYFAAGTPICCEPTEWHTKNINCSVKPTDQSIKPFDWFIKSTDRFIRKSTDQQDNPLCIKTTGWFIETVDQPIESGNWSIEPISRLIIVSSTTAYSREDRIN